LKSQTSVKPIFTKLFLYEFRRIVLHKFYLGTFLVCAFFNWQILRTETILGISHTAPFSGWSFGVYLGHSVPLLLFIVFFFLYQLYYGNERHVRMLISATAISPQYYLLIRCVAIWMALLFLVAAIVIQGMVFLWDLFPGIFSVTELLIPVLFVFLPALSLSFGLGLCSIQLHPAFFIASIFFLLFSEPLAAFLWQNSSWFFITAISLSGSSFFSEYPLTLTDADACFSVTKSVAMVRILIFLLGSYSIFIGIQKIEIWKNKK